MTKILIVEDDPMISEIYEKKFKSAGFDAVVASNGREVISNVGKDKFDLVLLDMVLPEMSGLEILKELKGGKYNPEMKVIMFSNLSEKSDRDEALKNGADGFIPKTQFNPSELVGEITRVLNEFGEQIKNEERLVSGVKNNGSKGKILFIEDEEVFIDMLGKKLVDDGYDVEFARDGAAALDSAMKNNFDLIITDIMLPHMNGDEIIRSLKGNEKTKNTPIIVLSASLDDEELQGVRKLGVDDCFMKTRIVPSDLSRTVDKLLKK